MLEIEVVWNILRSVDSCRILSNFMKIGGIVKGTGTTLNYALGKHYTTFFDKIIPLIFIFFTKKYFFLFLSPFYHTSQHFSTQFIIFSSRFDIIHHFLLFFFIFRQYYLFSVNFLYFPSIYFKISIFPTIFYLFHHFSTISLIFFTNINNICYFSTYSTIIIHIATFYNKKLYFSTIYIKILQ